MNEVLKGLDLVSAYFDDVTDFEPDLSTHVAIMKELLLRLRKHNLTLSPSKVKNGATDAGFLGHTISFGEVKPHTGKVEALKKMPMPKH